ncbi:hypothetical protein RUND412_011006 [Rhizina undulata]
MSHGGRRVYWREHEIERMEAYILHVAPAFPLTEAELEQQELTQESYGHQNGDDYDDFWVLVDEDTFYEHHRQEKDKLRQNHTFDRLWDKSKVKYTVGMLLR